MLLINPSQIPAVKYSALLNQYSQGGSTHQYCCFVDLSSSYVVSAPIPISIRDNNNLPPSLGTSCNPSLEKVAEPPTHQASKVEKIQGTICNPVSSRQTPVATSSSMPECWKRMLQYIDLYSTVPETKNVTKKVSIIPSSIPKLLHALQLSCR